MRVFIARANAIVLNRLLLIVVFSSFSVVAAVADVVSQLAISSTAAAADAAQ